MQPSSVPLPRSTSHFDQTFLSVGYVKKSTQCRGCKKAILPAHVKMGLVRQVVTSRYPCTKAHWYHPLCLPQSELRIVEQFGSKDGESVNLQSACDGMDQLTKVHRDFVPALLETATAQQPKQFPTSFTEVGKLMHVTRKRKTNEDEEFIPGGAASVGSTKRRFAGACRLVVQDMMATFKQQFYKEHADSDGLVHCAVSDELVSSADAHVDHAPPHSFDAIVEDFLAAYSQLHSTSRGQLLAHTEYVAGRFFDHEFSQAFRTYHAAHASLRILTATSNLKLPRKKKQTLAPPAAAAAQ